MADSSNRFATISDNLFLSALVISKTDSLTFPFIGHLCFLVSSLLYLIAYTLWNIAIWHADSPPLESNIKQQCDNIAAHQCTREYRLATYFGVAAAILALFSLSQPVVAAVSAWLFLASNSCWCHAEYLKHHAPNDNATRLQRRKQQHYFTYARLITSISIVSAISLTIGLINPALGIILAPPTLILFSVLNIMALYHMVRNVQLGRQIVREQALINEQLAESASEPTLISSPVRLHQRLPPQAAAKSQTQPPAIPRAQRPALVKPSFSPTAAATNGLRLN